MYLQEDAHAEARGPGQSARSGLGRRGHVLLATIASQINRTVGQFAGHDQLRGHRRRRFMLRSDVLAPSRGRVRPVRVGRAVVRRLGESGQVVGRDRDPLRGVMFVGAAVLSHCYFNLETSLTHVLVRFA